MSRNQRILVVAAAAVAVVVAYLIAKPGGGSKSSSSTPSVTRIRLSKDHVVGGPKKIKLKRNVRATIVASADAKNTLHLHGYDIEKTALPGKPARFVFRANQTGVFEFESHTFEDSGRPAQVAKVLVEP